MKNVLIEKSVLLIMYVNYIYYGWYVHVDPGNSGGGPEGPWGIPQGVHLGVPGDLPGVPPGVPGGPGGVSGGTWGSRWVCYFGGAWSMRSAEHAPGSGLCYA